MFFASSLLYGGNVGGKMAVKLAVKLAVIS